MKKVISKFIYLSIIIICIFKSTNSYSQTNFETGYVIDLNNDTIKGSMDYFNWNYTPKRITFKTLSDSKVTIYNPNNIQGFSVSGERYVSGIVTIDESPYRDNDLAQTEKPQYRTDTVFLQILIEGGKSLFSLKDENLKMHFFIGQDKTYEMLVFNKYLETVNGVTYSKTNEKFKGQLILYFQDCPSIQKNVSYVLYNKTDLINLFKEYYKETKNEIVYKYESEKLKFKSEFGFLGGLSLTKVKFFGNDDFYNPPIHTDYPQSINFTFGGFLNIILPRVKNKMSMKSKWSINNELVYTSYKVSRQWLDYYNSNIYTNTYSSLGSSYIKLNNMLKFKYPVKKMFLYVNGGISNGIAFSETNHLKLVSQIYSNNTVSESQAVY